MNQELALDKRGASACMQLSEGRVMATFYLQELFRYFAFKKMILVRNYSFNLDVYLLYSTETITVFIFQMKTVSTKNVHHYNKFLKVDIASMADIVNFSKNK